MRFLRHRKLQSLLPALRLQPTSGCYDHSHVPNLTSAASSLLLLEPAGSILRLSSTANAAYSSQSRGLFGGWQCWLAAAGIAGFAVAFSPSAHARQDNLSSRSTDPTAPSAAIQAASDVSSSDEQVVAALTEWLKARGVELCHVEIKASQLSSDAGLGLFSTRRLHAPEHGNGRPWWLRWWPRVGAHAEPVTLASFPLSSAITANNICKDPSYGTKYSWMFERGLLDERSLIMFYLVLERLKGAQSALYPWLQALPQKVHTPLQLSEQQLAALRGTTLAAASAAMRKKLMQQWSFMGEALKSLAKEDGLREPVFDDMLWAHGVFWSRGQSLPVPSTGAASQAAATSSSSSAAIAVQEGIVPGLDFANHSPQGAQCWWEVVAHDSTSGNASNSSSKARSRDSASSSGRNSAMQDDGVKVQLQLHTGASVSKGSELFISYGDKSNEELLLLHGFVIDHNPSDYLMLHCPLPPTDQWDDLLSARMELLRAYGLKSQFFLKDPATLTAQQQLPPSISKASEHSKRISRPSQDASSAEATSEGGAFSLPGDILDTLEVFVLSASEVAERMESLRVYHEARRAARSAGSEVPYTSQHSPSLDLTSITTHAASGSMTRAELAHAAHELGLRMATLTTLIRLLEVKAMELEDPSTGTGALEEDLHLLAVHEKAAARAAVKARARAWQAKQDTGAAAAKGGALSVPGSSGQGQSRQAEVTRGSDAEGVSAAAGGADSDSEAVKGMLPPAVRSAVVYRVGQKRLARAWLSRTKQELGALMRAIHAVHAAQKA